jgi:hypothetical protein
VITMLLGAPPDGVEWDETERAALGALADSGLVQPLLLTQTWDDDRVGRRHRAG